MATATIMVNTRLAWEAENYLASHCGVTRLIPTIWEATMFESDQFGWTTKVVVARRYLSLLRDYTHTSHLETG